ncbi:MAG: hypothetical protein WHS87_07385 [Anaerolineales bacterium]
MHELISHPRSALSSDVIIFDVTPPVGIPRGLWPHFQEYDPEHLNLEQDADLIIQRTLEYGTWEELRWLIKSYGIERIREFVRRHGERLLSPPTFTFWRKLLGLRSWRRAPFRKEAKQIWPF